MPVRHSGTGSTEHMTENIAATSKTTHTRKGAATKSRILDAAETLFAARGLIGTSIRDIAELAEVEQGLISYYFKSKDELFREVVARCIIGALAVQSSALDDLLHGDVAQTAEAILHVYTESALQPLMRGDHRFVNVVRLSTQVMHLSDKRHLLAPIAENYGPLRQRYLAALRHALPDYDEASVKWGFKVFEATYSYLLMNCARVGDAVLAREQIEEMRQRLAAFCAAGFLGLARS